MTRVQDRDDRSFTEEIQVRGAELVDKVKALIQEGNVRRVVVRRPTGEALVEIPLSAGVGIAGLLTLMTPVLAALGAMAALIADFRVQIVREPPGATQDPPKLLTPSEDEDADGEGGYVSRGGNGGGRP
jgi:Domain of unknown function (DUF4342)